MISESLMRTNFNKACSTGSNKNLKCLKLYEQNSLSISALRYIEIGWILSLKFLSLGCMLSMLCALYTVPEETMQDKLIRLVT